jgi:glycosyltransferase involved in cell wall biosynthesis
VIGAGIVATSDVDGGAEEYLRRLYVGLAERGIRGHLLGDLPRWGSTDLAQTSLGFGAKWSMRTLPSVPVRLPLERRRAIKAARHLVESGVVSMFHLQFKREQVSLTRALSHLAPVVWTEHGALPAQGLRSAIICPYRAAARQVEAIVCVSEPLRDQLETLLPSPRPKLMVIPNGVDLDRFRPASPEEKSAARVAYGVESDAIVVGSVGRLHPGKNVDLAIAAVARLPQVVLLVAGTGPDESRLRLAAGSNVHFLGHVDDVSRVYRALDVLVFTSTGLGEGVPLAVLEAAAAGVPTAAVDGSGAEPVAEELGGVTVTRDADALGAAVVKLTGRLASRDRVAARYGRDAWLDAHSALFKQLAGSRAAR